MRARSVISVAAIGLLAASPVLAAAPKEPGTAELLAEIRRLASRVEELERAKTAQAPIEQRIEKLENHNAAMEKAMDQDTISETEPQIAARLKAAENDILSYKKGSKTIDVLGGIKVGAGMTVVGQNLIGQSQEKDGQLNWRGDVTLTIPAGTVGDNRGTIFTHLRMGQGRGLSNVSNSLASVNGTAFQRSGADNTDAAIGLVEAWYQLDVPFGGDMKTAKHHMEITAGKMDPFGFFDKNAVANDETIYFMNSTLVHNALLDAGGDVGVDPFGFSPGLRLAYVSDADKWKVQAAVFETGTGASFQGSNEFPFRIVQAETTERFFDGLEGTYRVYGWTNDRATDFDNKRGRHAGVGLSLDQKVDDYVTLFGRYGYQLKGKTRFDQSVSAGGEVNGSYWGRGADGLGLGLVANHVSKTYRDKSARLDNDNDGTPDLGYKATAFEQSAELYYRYRVMPRFDLTPDFQLIRHPGGNPSGEVAYALGLRGQLTY
ncbi:hypothetical protein CCC_01049 [Paramagnetospirillum magnetotacticum MS-1]|uniref:Uncharacterized protein n=1 Tax=Paramagnetospirillum magnetotacticum MS-1 TaxID=272627 RepID=A0A0C2YS78_PARME|nr:carbohydrate porin [Paramagnetospirillum magnetotacticum]KIL97988.1 hypothetical protein CCC_01049 [Paramagnetospirillum magnetotacticum MS-1]